MSPENITAPHISDTWILLHWDSRDLANTSRLEITYRPVGASYRILKEVSSNLSEAVLENLLPKTEYEVFVVVTDLDGAVGYKSDVKRFQTLRVGKNRY